MKNICFFVNGIGNGHLTQADTIFNILQGTNNYNVKIVYIINNKNIFNDNLKLYKNKFKNTKIKNISINSNESTISNIYNPINFLKMIKDFNKVKIDEQLLISRKIDLIISFFIPKFFIKKINIKCIDIACQYCINNIIIKILSYNKIYNNIIPVSIGNKNIYSKYYIKSLISLEELDRKNVNKKIALAYNAFGDNFTNILNKIAKNNKEFKIYLFMKENPKKKLEDNIIFNYCSNKFKKILKIASCVLCTSGNELIQECVYNNIPVATIYCSNKHFEQVYNYNNYIKKKYAIHMDENLNLEKISKINNIKISNKFKKRINNRDKEIINIIDNI
jgi:UDP-N-acetylglucosamine:LPS N-acetylglucosamine transferase